MKSVFDAQRMAAMVQTKRGKQSLRDAASEIGVSAATLQRIERAEISDIAIALLVSDWLALPLQDFVEQQMNITPTTEQLIEQIRLKAQVTGYGPTGLRPRNTTLAGFWCLPATSEQIRVTEELFGFPLPKELATLYLSLANGGFGPAAGLRGTVGGYGTRYTALPNGGMFYNEETIVKFHLWAEDYLVDLNAYTADQWKQQPSGSKVLPLPAEAWPRQIIPLCDWGDCVEVCCDQHGFLCYWYASERPGYYELEKTVKPFNSWLQEWAMKKV